MSPLAKPCIVCGNAYGGGHMWGSLKHIPTLGNIHWKCMQKVLMEAMSVESVITLNKRMKQQEVGIDYACLICGRDDKWGIHGCSVPDKERYDESQALRWNDKLNRFCHAPCLIWFIQVNQNLGLDLEPVLNIINRTPKNEGDSRRKEVDRDSD